MNIKMYIGLTTQSGGYLSSDDVIKKVSELFEDFTVIETIGYYRGKKENSLCFELYNVAYDRNSICGLAKLLDQECIGIYNLSTNEFDLYFGKDYDPLEDEYLFSHYLFNEFKKRERI